MPQRKLSAPGQRVVECFDSACDRMEPLAPDRRLLLACSAGGDSMTLLDLAARAAKRRHWSLAVVHVDHAQRPASAGESQVVADEVRRRRLRFFGERLDDDLIAASPLSEDVMRRARHAIYRRCAEQWEADAIALAHQADDRAETFLIRLLAGSGPTGLSSIRPIERMGGLTLVRPLLSARRQDMRAYLRDRELTWHDDASNTDLATKRGWLRHDLLPRIRDHIGLDPTNRIVRASELIEDEAIALTEATHWMIDQLALEAPPPACARLDLTHPLWTGAGALLRRQLLRQWLWNLRRGAHPPGYAAVAEALAFAESGRRGAQLRTIERMHIVHCRTSLLAFDPSIDEPTRRVVAKPLLPPPKTPKTKKKNHKND